MKNPYLAKFIKMLKSHLLMSVIIYGLAAGVLAGALWFAFQFVDPLPPNKVTIVSGGPGGAYHGYAEQYARFFAKHGYELEIIQTNGSMDNLARISDPEVDVQAALMQGGITTPEEHPTLQSLGSLYYEPVWLFHKKRLKIKTLADLKGRTIAVGTKGSGTNHLVTSLLDENEVTIEDAKLVEAGASAAIPMLMKGKIDALVTIAGIDSKAVEDLIHAQKKVELYSFQRAETYARTHHYLKKLTLPQGGIDLVDNLPNKDVSLLAPSANLVVREDLHPAIKYLFLLAADEVHSKGDMFARPDTFPNDESVLFPLSNEAVNFYKSGPPFLMRYLPFQLAITVERLKILLIPLLTLLFPLFKITPPAYRWQIRRRIFKWYKHLKKLDMEAYEMKNTEDAEKMLAQLERMDRMVLETSVPLSYTDYIYSLRLHIRMIEDRLKKVIEEDTGTTA